VNDTTRLYYALCDAAQRLKWIGVGVAIGWFLWRHK